MIICLQLRAHGFRFRGDPDVQHTKGELVVQVVRVALTMHTTTPVAENLLVYWASVHIWPNRRVVQRFSERYMMDFRKQPFLFQASNAPGMN